MGGPAPSGPAPETPLTKIMPPLVALPRQVITTALTLTGRCNARFTGCGLVKVGSMVAGSMHDHDCAQLARLQAT